jgi:hypothetical protein
MMNRERLVVRISPIIQYHNVRRAYNRAAFHPSFPPSTAANPHQNRQSPADRPRVCRPGKYSGAPQRLIHSSHQPQSAPRRRYVVALSAGGLAQDPAPGGRWQDDVLARKAIVGGGQSAAENSSAHDLAASSMRTPQRAGPTSARSTKPSWRRISAFERAAGETAVDHHAAKAARKHPDAGTVELFRGRVRG